MSKKNLAYLLIIPLALFINAMLNPSDYWPVNSSVGEMLFLVFGLPILAVNYLIRFGNFAND